MNAAPTLNQFFNLKNIALPADRLTALDSSGNMPALKKLILQQTKGLGWGVLREEILKKVEDLLNISLPEIFTAAWNKYHILLQYLDRQKYPPNESFLVPLAEHTINSEHHPSLEIMINEQPVGKINFAISVALTLEGIILKIQDGKIKEIFTGTCKGKGTVKCEDQVILEEKMKSLSLPGSIDLGEGIPIAPYTSNKVF